MKRILYLTYDGLTDQLGQSQIIPYLTGLSAKGFFITVISFEKKDAFRQKGNTIYAQLKQAGITWHSLNYHKSPPILSTLYDIRRMRNEALRLHAINPFNVLHCRSYITTLTGLYFKKNKKIPFIFDMRGFWADERIDGNIWSTKNPIYNIIYKYFKKKEKDFLSESNTVVSLTESAKNIILSWNLPHVNSKKIVVIPCCADLELFNAANMLPGRINQLRSDTGITENSFSITYLGAIGTWYMLEEMLRFYKRLLINFPKAKFLILTGENPKYIFDAAAKLNVEAEGIVIRKAERKDVPSYLSLCRLSIFFIRQAFSKTASCPTKLGEILAMEIPVICNAGIGDVDSQIGSTKAGIIVDDFSDESFDRVINQIPSLLKSSKDEIRKVAEDFYSLEKGVSKYDVVYKSI